MLIDSCLFKVLVSKIGQWVVVTAKRCREDLAYLIFQPYRNDPVKRLAGDNVQRLDQGKDTKIEKKPRNHDQKLIAKRFGD